MTPGPRPIRSTDLVALVVLLTFGCATTKPPLPPQEEVPPITRVAVEEPEIQLWVDDDGPMPAAEVEKAQREARSTLEAALAAVQTSPEPQAVLLVRERAVALTSARNTQKVGAIVGIVVVAVAVVVVIAIGLAAMGSSGGGKSAPTGSGGSKAAKSSGGGARAPAPQTAAPAAPRASPPPARAAGAPPSVPSVPAAAAPARAAAPVVATARPPPPRPSTSTPPAPTGLGLLSRSGRATIPAPPRTATGIPPGPGLPPGTGPVWPPPPPYPYGVPYPWMPAPEQLFDVGMQILVEIPFSPPPPGPYAYAVEGGAGPPGGGASSGAPPWAAAAPPGAEAGTGGPGTGGEVPEEVRPVYDPPADPFAHAGQASLDLTSRSFWDGTETVLDMALEDATTGAVLWSVTVRTDADPRDRKAVARLVREALGKAPFLRPER